MAVQPPRPISQPAPRPSEFGRAVARVLCIVFGILGALPLGAGFFARSDFAQAWLSVETARLLHESLGLTAKYSSSLSLWPLQIAIERLEVEGEDGLGPAIVANRIAITPRVFSLIAGRLDVGDIELQGVHGRVVVEHGVVTNLHVKLPETESSPETPTRSPFRTFSASNVSLDLTLDGMHLESGNLDLDVFSEGGLTFEASLGLGETYVRYPQDFFTHGYTHDIVLPAYGPQQLSQWEEDRICQLSARIRLSPESVLIRSFSIQGASDINFSPGDHVACPTNEAERQGLDKFDIRARQVHIEPPTEESPLFLRGYINAKLPVNLMNRLQDEAGPFDGLATVEGDISYDGTSHLPEFTGKVTTGDFKIDGFRVTESSAGEVVLKNDRVYVPKIHIRYGGGTVDIADVAVGVLERGVPLTSKVVEGRDIHFPYMIRDLKVTPDTIINWSLDKIRVTDFKGNLDPPRLFGDLHVESTDFEIFDRSYRDPRRTRMFGIKPPATLDGRFGLTFFGLEFNDIKARFGESSLTSTVNVRFNNTIRGEVSEAKLNLEEMSPLVTVPMAGIASLQATLEGPMPNPLMLGKVGIKDFVFGGFPLGDLGTTDLRFRPLWLELSAATLHKGQSKFFFPHTRFDFQANAALVVKARMETEQAELRDFLRLFNFDSDPRWKDLEGSTRARTDIDFVLGGSRDPCEHGNLLVRGELSAENATIFGQDYDSVNTDLFFHWDDIEASYHGMSVDLTGVRLTKGAGSIVGSAHIRPGANILGNLVATSVPINQLQGFGTIAEIMNGTVSAVAQVSGTLDQLETKAQVQLSPVIVGRSRYPGSNLFVNLSPIKAPVMSDRLTPCKRPIPLPSEPGDFEADKANGTFTFDGQLFGGQVLFRDFQITRQNSKVARGVIQFKELDLGPLMEHYPSLALSDKRPTGRLSADLNIQGWPFDAPSKSEGSLSVSSFWVSNNGYRASLQTEAPFRMARGEAKIPDSVLELRTPLGPTAVIAAHGSLQRLQTSPSVDVSLELRPVDLKDWQSVFDSAEELEGTLRGEVQVSGAWSKPRYRGGFTLRNGALTALDGKLVFTAIGADVTLQNNLLSLENATASIGGGSVTARAQVPVNGLRLGRLEGTLAATNVAYSLADDIQSTLSANLEGVWPDFGDDSAAAELPKVTGNIDVLSFTYKRPVSMSADISSLTRRGKRTEFESYDPSLDKAELDVLITSSAPLRLENNLVKASLSLDKPGLQLTGTNQRFGVRGRMEVAKGGHIQLRRNEFEIQTGEVRFDDSTAITPRVDVTAITEYRRYGASEGAVSASDTTAGTGGTGPGQWRISLHAHGDADDLKIDLSSEPSLSQDDAFLLLTVGLTRAELDRAQSAGLGQSVALEALGSLTGADTAVTDAIPLIDDFGFGSEYSSQTGRTEPTVTISKRLSERVRAYVTSRLTEARDVRSNVEWTLSPHVSVQGSYDNINSFSTPNLGNLGADVRWRLEFE